MFFNTLIAFFSALENVALATERVSGDILLMEGDDDKGTKTLAAIKAQGSIKAAMRAARDEG